jgi:hypothetical protein
MKKKINLKTIAMLGMASGILASYQQADAASHGNSGNPYIALAGESSNTLTEQTLYSQLNPETQQLYNSLNPEGKALALKLVNQDCKGHNDCKGLNSCATESNTCAGHGGCKGTSKAPFTDKNVAVKVAAMNMAKKRSQMMNDQ